MAEISPFPDEEGLRLEEDNSKVEEIIAAALLLFTSRSPSTIRKQYASGTLPDLIVKLIDEFKVNLDTTANTLLGTANYGARLVVDRLDSYSGDDVKVMIGDIDDILSEHIDYIVNSTRTSIIDVQLEEIETTISVLPFIIGLNANQSKKLINYYKASEGKRQLATIERTLSRMRDEALSYRAKLISVSLTEDVLEQGKIVAARKIQEATNLTLYKTWNTSFINSCAVCVGLNGETVPIDRPFSTGIFRPKAHSNCACALTITEGDT
jgi:hypothetical protein